MTLLLYAWQTVGAAVLLLLAAVLATRPGRPVHRELVVLLARLTWPAVRATRRVRGDRLRMLLYALAAGPGWPVTVTAAICGRRR